MRQLASYLPVLFHVLARCARQSEVKLNSMLTGSDKEAALVKAIRVAFPNTKHLLYILYCEDNVRNHVTKEGVRWQLKRNC